MMRFSKLQLSLLVLVPSLFACKSELTYDGNCGELKEFKVDKAYCQQYGLTENSFLIQYPSNLEIETQEDYASTNYASFFKFDEDTNIVEGINIGYYVGLTESGGNSMLGGMLGLTKESLLSSLVNQLRAQGLNLEDVTMQDEKVNGEDHFTTRAKLTADKADIGFKGSYLIQMVLVATDDEQGLLLVMSARDDSGIKTFEDFDTKGCISTVLQSLD